MKTVLSVVGARPNFMKVAPLHRAFHAHAGRIRHRVVHTGQHYDDKMSKVFFDNLELPQPDVYLGVGSGSHAQQTSRIMTAFEGVIESERPDLVIVPGDVNSTLACSLVAAKAGVKLAHVEAGLRSFDRTMPEEINRVVADALSDLLFVTEPSGLENLRKEGVPEGKVHLVGNTMIDSLVSFRMKAQASTILTDLDLPIHAYLLVTLHRPSTVDNRESLGRVVRFLTDYGRRLPVVFPVHPRTRKMMAEFGLLESAERAQGLRLVEPLGYLDFLRAMEGAQVVLTDSGGVQEETTYLNIPCLTLRDNTERPVTITVGSNVLCGSDIEKARPHLDSVLSGTYKRGRVPELWDGRAAERIVDVVFNYLS